jgi:riboflavin synthase
MFTGIVEGTGKVMKVEFREQGRRLALSVPPGLTDVQLGDSINVNGACLTVVEINREVIRVDLSNETLQRTTLSEIREGDSVNLERALRLSDRLGGHIVTGHVDGIGTIAELRRERDFLQIKIRAPQSVSKYVVEKGSIAVDGTSLTVNETRGDVIDLTLIPFTLEKTVLIHKRVGDRVNLEADILGKYVEKMLDRSSSEKVTLSFLKEHGFIDGEE